MKNIVITAILLVCASPCFAAAGSPRYAVARIPTPVINAPDFAAVFGGRDGRSLAADDCGLLRAMEFVALPGTVFTIEAELTKKKLRTFRVTTADYPYPSKTGYYIDSRFVTVTDKKPVERPRQLPSRQAIIDSMLAAKGCSYVWGGNVRAGIPQLLTFFPPAGTSALYGKTAAAWQLKGVDCSGLLYEATGGFTPRNTSELLGYGKGVAIAGKTVDEIQKLVEPLDLIVWQGHVIIILNGEQTIESRLDCGGTAGGVVVRPLRQALDGIMKGRVAVNEPHEAAPQGKKTFVIRRWYPQQ